MGDVRPSPKNMKAEIPIKFGLGDSPDTLFVFVGGNDGEAGASYSWYRLDDQSNRVPIYEPCITGFLTGIKGVRKDSRRGVAYKVDVTIRGDRPYTIRSGIETHFSRGLLTALEIVDDLQAPLSVVTRQGDEGKVIFCDLYDPRTCKKFWPERNDDRDWFALLFELQKRLRVEVQTKQTIDNPPAPGNARSGPVGIEPSAEHDRLDEAISKLWTAKERPMTYAAAVKKKLNVRVEDLSIGQKREILRGLETEDV